MILVKGLLASCMFDNALKNSLYKVLTCDPVKTVFIILHKLILNLKLKLLNNAIKYNIVVIVF